MFKKIIAVIAVALVLGGTALAFSYWDNLEQTSNETITIGEGVSLDVVAVAAAPAGKVLVPSGVVLKANDVESIVLTYNVALDSAALTDLDLAVVASDIQIGGETTNASLITVNVSQAATTVNDANVLVTVTVTMAQPADVTVYNAIINQPITFLLTFTATIA
ncbi:hypothetical protein RJI07_02940 [Mycoplasmatota bacterium WC30]